MELHQTKGVKHQKRDTREVDLATVRALSLRYGRELQRPFCRHISRYVHVREERDRRRGGQ
jgi:hypothetical protein